MEQATFAELEHDSRKRRTRRDLFLERMDGLVPWEALEALIEPFCPKPGRGRRPCPLRAMLRVHCVQPWCDVSDPGMEDPLCEAESVRRFAGLRLSGALPDETTILKFRRLLERHGLGEGLFEAIKAHLADEGHSLRRGTIVDASIVAAPSSTKSRKGGQRRSRHTNISSHGKWGDVLRWHGAPRPVHRPWRSDEERPLACQVVSGCGCRSETARTAPRAVAERLAGLHGDGFAEAGARQAPNPRRPTPTCAETASRSATAMCEILLSRVIHCAWSCGTNCLCVG